MKVGLIIKIEQIGKIKWRASSVMVSSINREKKEIKMRVEEG